MCQVHMYGYRRTAEDELVCGSRQEGCCDVKIFGESSSGYHM